MEW
ncbi:hypothetical protein D039_4021A, partial [Vibrio parahaemolyticus EKP-028]|jgi:hypothetical protein